MTRRADKGLGKTTAGGSGGSFAAHDRDQATPPTAAIPASLHAVVPGRKVKLWAPNRPVSWPDGMSPQSVTLGEDDSGRPFTSFAFEYDGQAFDAICTTETDGFGGHETVISGDDGFDVLDEGETGALRDSLESAHGNMMINAQRTGMRSLESNQQLRQQVIDASLGSTEISSGVSDAATDRGVARAEAGLSGWDVDPGEPETQIQDVMTDLAHLADKHGVDIDAIFARAKWMHDSEVEDPHL